MRFTVPRQSKWVREHMARQNRADPREVRYVGQRTDDIFSRKSGAGWWRVYSLGKISQYHCGYVCGGQEQAVELARKYWPEFIGKLILEPVL